MPAATIESRSPQDPDDLIATVPCADRQAVEPALAAARRVAPAWATGSALAGANALTATAAAVAAAAAELTYLMVPKVGKPIGKAGAEVKPTTEVSGP
jgi:acyl-CoA reductase-like NAD-dependent aldehyde dehydrogenase